MKFAATQANDKGHSSQPAGESLHPSWVGSGRRGRLTPLFVETYNCTMGRTFLVLVLAALLAPCPVFGQLPEQTKPAPSPQGPIRVRVDVVNVIFTVMDKHNRFITELGRGDFQVSEDGRPQEIGYFSRETDLPLRIGLLIDTSNSIRPRFQFEQEAAIDFFHTVLRRGKDQAFLMSFDMVPEVVQDFTDDPEPLAEAVRRLRAGGGTVLYDGVYEAAKKMMNVRAPAGQSVRKLLVVLSDGEDTVSNRTREEALDMAQRADLTVFCISTNTGLPEAGDRRSLERPALESWGDKVLRRFAEETGARAFFPFKVEDLAQSFEEIGTELRHQYSLGYTPTNIARDGGFRKITIAASRKDAKVRARRGYYAPRD